LDFPFGLNRIRLADMNTPEKNQPGFQEATDKVNELAPVGTKCILYCKGKDRYGRYIGHVVASGVSINIAMMESGLAKPYKET
jgi:micrococcal nuclease